LVNPPYANFLIQRAKSQFRRDIAMSAKRIARGRKRKTPALGNKAGRRSKSLRRRFARGQPNPSFAFIDAAAQVLDLPIDPAWKPAIAGHLETTLRLAALVMDFSLADDAEPAPVFVA
jgi:hypothetical protein